MEYIPGPDGYITWFSDGKPTWTMFPSAIGKCIPTLGWIFPDIFNIEGADSLVNISAREIPAEPMYLIMNLGYSYGFGDNVSDVRDTPNSNQSSQTFHSTQISPDLTFPATMSVDYIRVYQVLSMIVHWGFHRLMQFVHRDRTRTTFKSAVILVRVLRKITLTSALILSDLTRHHVLTLA